MHLLTSLVKFRNQIDKSIFNLSLDNDIHNKITLLNNIDEPIKNRYTLNEIREQYQKLLKDSNTILDNLKTLSDNVTNEIKVVSDKMFCSEDYYAKWTGGPGQEAIEYDAWELFQYRINQYSDWRYPGLIINPYSKKIIDALVASDPLYILSNHIDLVNELISNYPIQYQKRLLIYNEREDFQQQLPKNQFGVVVIFGEFNHLSLTAIRSYLKKLFLLVRPGGSIIFTFNNCDIEEITPLAVNWTIPYASKTAITDIVKDIGFDIVCFKDRPTHDPCVTYMSWVEITKPGILTGVKRAQPIGEVCKK